MSPASKEEIAAVIAETQRIHDSQPPHRTLVDAQGREPPEERPVVLTEKMRVSYPLVVALLTLVVVVAGSFARGQALAQQVDAQEASAKAVAAEVRALQVDAALNAEQHKAILEALKEIKSDLKELKAAVAVKK